MDSARQVAPLFEATRGSMVESVQYGAFAVVSADGQLKAGYGDPDLVTFMRSTSKPLQAIAFMERNGDARFQLSPTEVAIMCASHAGTDRHVEVLQSFHRKVGLTESQLQCGIHPPFDRETRDHLLLENRPSSPYRHNCSGKHTGMLALTVLMGFSLEHYTELSHPVQQLILKTFAEMVDLPPEQVVIGVDGCSVPTYAVPMRSAAYGFARLCDPAGLAPERADACRRITCAMSANGLMIAGPGRFDTVLMDIAAGKLVSKLGAEGYQGLGILPDAIEPGSPALGVAIKISDGDELMRARPMAALQILRDLGVLSKSELDQLADFDRRPIYNFRHLEVGEYRPAFTLQ